MKIQEYPESGERGWQFPTARCPKAAGDKPSARIQGAVATANDHQVNLMLVATNQFRC